MIFKKWRNRPPAQSAAEVQVEEQRPNRLDLLLAERVGAHFPDAQVDGHVVHTGTAGLRIDCMTEAPTPSGAGNVAVPLFFHLSGGAFGPRPRFASVSGYAADAESAVVEGACLWTCTFGPVLGSGLTGSTHPDTTVFEVVRDGRRYRGVVASMDRAMTFGAGAPDPASVCPRARDLLGGDPLLTPRVAATGDLPPFVGDAVLLSVFVMLFPHQVTYEVKVNGRDWEPASVRSGPAEGIPDAGAMLRELAVLVPVPDPQDDAEPAAGPFAAGTDEAFPPLTRSEVEAGLAALAGHTARAAAAGWPGWLAHGGSLAPPVGEDDLQRIEERSGALPADYRQFLATVAGPGSAGPGYGLAEPVRVEDRLLLAHGGCKVAWVLRLDEGHVGEVWLDAREDHESFVQVAPGFTAWYRRWLQDAAAEDRPWVQWDLTACPTVDVSSQVLAQMREQGTEPDDEVTLALSSGPSPYLPEGPMDPCQGCCGYLASSTTAQVSVRPGPLAARSTA